MDVIFQFLTGNCRIELIEAFTCDNKEKHNDQLNYHIENAECINTDEMDRMKDFLEQKLSVIIIKRII